MPSPPKQLVQGMMEATPNHRWIPRRNVLAFAGCGALVAAVFVLMPQQSSAAASLDRLVAGHGESDVLYRVTPYWIIDGNKVPKIWSGYVKGNQWHYIQEDFEQASDGMTVITYFPEEGRAHTWKASSSGEDSSSVFPEGDLSWWKNQPSKEIDYQHNVKWNGQTVDRYEIVTYSPSWGATTNILFADPVANRPLYSESLHASGDGNAMEWEYPDSEDESVLRIQMKPGIEVKDITTQREQEKLKGNGTSAQTANGR